MLAHQLLSEFNAKKKSIAVVLDEFGGTSGIVTTEDLIESVIGEIDDEYDEATEKNLIEEKKSENHFVFSARHEIDYLNKKYELNIPEGEYTTLAGFITSISGIIPQKGEIITYENLKIKVIESTPIRIELVEVQIENQA
jgi:CBS domain containing-hemolysin-like protein